MGPLVCGFGTSRYIHSSVHQDFDRLNRVQRFQINEAASLSTTTLSAASCLPLSGGIILIEGRRRVSISVSPDGIAA